MVTHANKVIKKSRTPKKLWEAARLMRTISQKAHTLVRISHIAKAKRAKIEEKEKKDLALVNEELETLISLLHSFAKANRDVVFKEGKTVSLVVGTFGWRPKAVSVAIAEGFTEEEVIQYLHKHGPQEFLRVNYEINREAIQEKRKTEAIIVPGISFTEDQEEFFISPEPKGRKKPKIITRKE